MSNIQPVKFIEETKDLRRNIEYGFLRLGERLHSIHEEKLWEGIYNTYEEFLTDIDLSAGQASKLRKIYSTLILEHGLDSSKLAPIGQKRLYSILPLCLDKNAAEEQIEAITGLSSSDVEKKVKAEVAGEHEHDWVDYRMCTLCKETHRVYDSE